MSDIGNIINSANGYLDSSVGIPSGATFDDTGSVIASTSSYSLREIICALMTGSGVKLPNYQMCLEINIGRLIPMIPASLGDLRNALIDVHMSLDMFIDHTSLDSILNRMNMLISEFASVANMIDFCSTPIHPRPIPNVLRDATHSLTGGGMDLLNTLGTISTGNIGGCIDMSSGNFNANIFTGGILGLLASNIDNLSNLPSSIMDNITRDLLGVSGDMREMVRAENDINSTDDNGGSTFSPVNEETHAGVGVLVDIDNMSVDDASKMATNLQGAYDQLSGYPVDDDGNSIFYYMLNPELLDRLQNKEDPNIASSDRVAVLDYCGMPTGEFEQSEPATARVSTGSPAERPIQPGIDAIVESGISTDTPISNLNTATVSPSAPLSSIGKEGDSKGDLASDGNYLYYATADYDGSSNIWVRSQLSSW